MSLVPLVTPNSEAEALAIVGLLEAYGIPVHVRGGGFGGLYPGAQPNSFNSKTIMVPEDLLQEARDLLKAVPELPLHDAD